MRITVKQKPITIKGVKKVNSLSDIVNCSRLFYELGGYTTLGWYKNIDGSIVENKRWNRDNVFVEIDDVKEFIKNNKRLTDKEYIEHHNFVFI
jgi:hypothetical protein